MSLNHLHRVCLCLCHTSVTQISQLRERERDEGPHSHTKLSINKYLLSAPFDAQFVFLYTPLLLLLFWAIHVLATSNLTRPDVAVVKEETIATRKERK